MMHELKTLPQYWDAVNEGRKTFEIRKHDRPFKMRDVLHLRRTIESFDENGKKIWIVDEAYLPLRVRINYILSGEEFGIMSGFVILGVRKIDEHS